MHLSVFPERNFKTASLSFAFLSVPMLTVLIMTGMGATLYLFILSAVVLLTVTGFAVSGRKRYISSGLFVIAFFLAATLIRCVPLYLNGSVYAEKVTEVLGNAPHSFEGYAANDDVDNSGGMFVEIVSVDGNVLDKAFKVYGINSSGHFIKEGTHITFDANIRKVENKQNSSFDTVCWLKGKGVHCEIYNIQELDLGYAGKRVSVGGIIREAVWSRVLKVLEYIPGKEAFERSAALCKALLFGDKSDFASDDLDAFTKSGMTHLLCVSGLHFSVIMGCLSFLLTLTVPDRRIRVVLLAVLATMYLCACGFSKSALRSAVMIMISTVGVAYGKRHGCTHSLLLATALICLIDPNAVFDVSFRLSVLSCAGIACAGFVTDITLKRLEYRPLLRYAAGVFMMSASCFCFTFAYSACAFGAVSVVSALSSLFAVLPAQICMIVSWLSIAVSFMGNGLLPFAFADIIFRLSDFIYGTAHFFSKLKYSYIQTDLPDLSFAVFILVLIVTGIVTASKSRAHTVYFYVFIISLMSVTLMLCQVAR